MAQDIKKSKKRTRKYHTDGPITTLAKNIAFLYNSEKDRRDAIKRKKDKATLKKNKDMIMGGIEGSRRPSGRKANPNSFTLGELGGMENPSYPLTKKQKTRIYGDPKARYNLKSRSSGLLKNKKSAFEKEYYESGGLTKTVPPKRGPNPQGLKNGGCPYRERGAKSDIQGIKDIQVKGKKFTGSV